MKEKLKSIYAFTKHLATIFKESLYEMKCTVRKFKIPESRLTTDALLLCHSLEKGMGIKNVKYGYGKEKATRLLQLTEKLISWPGYENQYVVLESIAVLWAYVEYQEKEGVDIENIKNRLVQLAPKNQYNAGFKTLLSNQIYTKFDYEEFVETRHSLRLTSDEKIKKEEIEKAVKIAIYAPSACNRQPCKVYYSLEGNKNADLAELVPGNKSFAKDIKYYCIVTANRDLFGGSECYQWYINGGIFLAFLVQAFHAEGIGSCIFQWPIHYKNEAKLRGLAGIKNPDEAIIAVVGYGKYPKSFKCIAAQRKPLNEVLELF